MCKLWDPWTIRPLYAVQEVTYDDHPHGRV